MDNTATALDRILDAATEEFGRAGFDGAKVEAIARLAGVNKAGLYYHVGNKERLYEAVLLRLFGQVAASLERAIEPGTEPGEAFARLTGAMATMFERLPMLPPDHGHGNGLGRARGCRTRPWPSSGASSASPRRCWPGARPRVPLRPAEPILVHMTLVGTLVVYCLSAPLRRRFAGAARDLGIATDLPVAEAAVFLADIVGRGLACREPGKEVPRETP